jgi:Kef-type K+ transport system membrane component KefB
VSELDGAILLADLALIVLLARVIGRLARACGQPAVIGEIVLGILLGPTLFNGAIAGALFPTDVRPYLSALANLGLVLFMFVVGLEFDFSRLRGYTRITGATVAGGTLVPFALGVLLSLYLAGEHAPSNPLAFTLFIGVAVSVTAFPVLARILTDRGMNRSRIGAIALTSAAVCDLVAWTMLAVVQMIAGQDQHNGWLVLLIVPYAAVLVGFVRPLLKRFLRTRAGPLRTGSLVVVLTGAFGSAAVSQLIGLHAVFGAFLFGLVIPRFDDVGFRAEVLQSTSVTTSLLLPVYFIVAGLNVDLSKVDATGWLELALIMVVAVAGKFGGTWTGARTQGMSSRRSAVLATLMNTRGLTELIALGVGLQMGVLDADLYSLMVVMAVVTTAMAGPLLRWLVTPEDVRVLSDELPMASAAAKLGSGRDVGGYR